MTKIATISFLSIGVLTVLFLGCATEPEKTVEVDRAPRASVADPAQNSVLVARGKELFATACNKCHTVDGLTNKSGPDLSDYGNHAFSQARVESMLRDYQRYYPGTMMPTWDTSYPAEDLRAVAAYVRSLKRQAFYLRKSRR